MILYYAILLSILFLAFIFDMAKSKGLKVIITLAMFLIIAIPASIRGEIGTDVKTYHFIFANLDNFYGKTEYAYYYLNKLVLVLGFDFQWVVASCAIISYYLCFRSFWIEKKYFSVQVVFFVLIMYLPSYSMLRQFFAISIIIFSLNKLLSGNIKQYAMLIFVASLFHLSALIMLVFILLRRIRVNGYILLSFIPIFALLTLKIDVFSVIKSLPLIGESKYALYAGGQFSQRPEIGSGLGLIAKLIAPVLLILLFRFRADKRSDLILQLSFVYIFCVLLSSQIQIFNRLVDLFMYVPILAIVQLIDMQKRHLSKVLVFLFFLVIYTGTFTQIINSSKVDAAGGLGINPYSISSDI